MLQPPDVRADYLGMAAVTSVQARTLQSKTSTSLSWARARGWTLAVGGASWALMMRHLLSRVVH